MRSKIPKSLLLSQAKPSSTSSKTQQRKVTHVKEKIEKSISKIKSRTKSAVNSSNPNGEILLTSKGNVSNKILKIKTSTSTKNRKEIGVIKCKHTEIGDIEVLKEKIKPSPRSYTGNENLKLLNMTSKSTKETKTDSQSFEIYESNNSVSENSSKKLIVSKKNRTAGLGHNQKYVVKKFVTDTKNTFTDITSQFKSTSKPAKSSNTSIKRKKIHKKKSKLSIIPEIRIELTEEKDSGATVHFPRIVSDSTTYASRVKYSQNYNKRDLENNINVQGEFQVNQEIPEIKHDKFNCNNIYNNNCLKKIRKSHRYKFSDVGSKYNSSGIKMRNESPCTEYPSNSDTMIKIRWFEKKSENSITYQKIEYVSSLNLLTISSKTCVSKRSSKILPYNYKKNVNHKLLTKTERKFKDSSSINDSYKTSNFNNNFNFFPNKNYKRKCPSYKFSTDDSWPKNLECCGDGSSMPIKVQKILNELGSRDHHKILSNYKCHMKLNSYHKCKFPSKRMTMSEGDGLPDQIYSRVSNWISSHDFQVRDNGKLDVEAETIISNDIPSDITSVTRTMARKKGEYDDIIIEERTDVVKCRECESHVSSEKKFSEMVKNINNNKSVRTLSKFSQYSPFQNSGNLKSASAPPTQFSVIVEGEESVCPSISYFFVNTLLLLYFSCAIYFYDFCLFCPY